MNIDKSHKRYKYVVGFVRVTTLIALAYTVYTQQWSFVFPILLTFLTTYLPNLFAKKISLPFDFYTLIILYMYAAFFLGEGGGYYEKFWWWDLALHTVSAFAFGFVGFLILYVLYQGKKVHAHPFLISVFAFTFAVALGALWEIFEFFLDTALGYNTLKSGINDTISDMIVNVIGALVAVIIGYRYVKYKEFKLKQLIKSFTRV